MAANNLHAISAILIDDEKSSLLSLEFEISEYCPEVEVIAKCQSPSEGLRQIQKLKPDLVFLDIEMPGMNGFELLQSIGEIDFDVIFVTAYDQFAVQAFEFNAVDYLLKPVRKTKLVQAVSKVLEHTNRHFTNDQLEALVNNVSLQASTGIEKIALPTSEGYEFVHINNILYLKAESNYTWVYLESNRKYLIAKTLKEMSSMISFPQFFRAHKSYLVNINHVARYVRGQGGYLVLDNGEQISVARGQKDALLKLLNI